jgi:hypothetical protein
MQIPPAEESTNERGHCVYGEEMLQRESANVQTVHDRLSVEYGDLEKIKSAYRRILSTRSEWPGRVSDEEVAKIQERNKKIEERQNEIALDMYALSVKQQSCVRPQDEW